MWGCRKSGSEPGLIQKHDLAARRRCRSDSFIPDIPPSRTVLIRASGVMAIMTWRMEGP